MRLDRAWIEEHIPHQGRMCLLDEVVSWDAERIRCRSGTHRAVDHPLRAHGRLGIVCGIEYASQAMAVHGALTAPAAGTAAAGTPVGGSPSAGSPAAGSPAAGFLASVRNVHLHVVRLDDIQEDLLCDAVRLAGDRRSALYEFELRSAAACVLSGRATVVLDASRRMPL